ncbi:MAG: ABC transporter substrate-binding protein [Synergistaceae bacterium]|nr:ABC transporter substrate-binding protein [Synergistaceae bacterium]
MKNLRAFPFFTAVIIALAAAPLISNLSVSPANSAVQTPFKFVVADAQTTHHLNLYVAHDLGIFEKYGLDVQIESVSDNAAARDLVVSGGADIFWSCPTVAIAAIANGAPIKSIAQVKRPCTSVLVVDPSSPIKTFADLKGKEIAGISPTCEAVISLAVKAGEAGGAFSLQKLAGGPAISALQSKSVDGAILEEPHVSIAELAGYKVVFPDVSANISCRTINASDRILAGEAENLKLFVRAVDEANKIILSNPTADNIVDIAVKYTGAPREAIIHGNDRLKFTTTLDRDGLRALGNELLKLGNIKENPGDKLFASAFKGITW